MSYPDVAYFDDSDSLIPHGDISPLDGNGECTPFAQQPKSFPHIDKATFKQIFRDYWEPFKAAHPRYNNEYYDDVIRKMLDCGDPLKMGYAQFRCLSCGHSHRVGFSCKSTFCLSCSKPYADRWVDFIGNRLLPGIAYRHFVLTMPDFLALWFYKFRELLDPLMKTGFTCLLDIFRTVAKQDLDIGSIIVLQTFGRASNYNPHLHILQTAGGFDKDGPPHLIEKWVPLSYFPYDLLHRKWQWYLLNMLKKLTSDPRISHDIDRAWKKYPKGFVAFVQKGLLPPGAKGLARYLAKYVVSPSIAIRRITAYDGCTVKYWYHDHKTEKIRHETLPVLKFIGRVVEHILPKGFQRIRYFGIHTNSRYAKVKQHLIDTVPNASNKIVPETFTIVPSPINHQLRFENFYKEPSRCPNCTVPITTAQWTLS